jgi:5-methylcytosine-specific restriction protein A
MASSRTPASKETKRTTAKSLAKDWGLQLAHAAYHWKGEWFHHLTSFPGALFDPQGYVEFPTAGDYRSSPHLRLNQHCHCPGGISQMPGYIRIASQFASDLEEPEATRRVPVTVSRIIRDTVLSQALKQLYDHQCQLCGVILELPSGRYSEAHHLRPLGKPHCGPDCRENLIVVCPTCHVRLDYFGVQIELGSLAVQRHLIGPDYLSYHNDKVIAATRELLSSKASPVR